MSMHHLIGKRIICQSIIPGTGMAMSAKECRVLEVSPSGEWIKLMHERNVSTWDRMSEVRIVEVLNGDCP